MHGKKIIGGYCSKFWRLLLKILAVLTQNIGGFYSEYWRLEILATQNVGGPD
jgi:hypothetical protein